MRNSDLSRGSRMSTRPARAPQHPRRNWARALALVVLLLGALVPAGTAWAAPTVDQEPNNFLDQIQGPISPEGVDGTIQTGNDVDRYLIQFNPQRQIRMTFTAVDGTCSFSLRNTSGSSSWYSSWDVSASGSNHQRATTWTTPPEPTTRHLVVSGYAGCRYQFRVTAADGGPTDAINTLPVPVYEVVEIGEPNESSEQAAGPLVGGVGYRGTIETGNDQDWTKLWLVPGRNLTLELKALNAGDVTATVYPASGSSSVASVSADGQTVQTTTFTVPTETSDYRIKVTGDVGARWQVRLLPPDVVTGAPIAPPPPPPPPATATSVSARGYARGRTTGVAGRVFGAAAGDVAIDVLSSGGYQQLATARVRANGRFSRTVTASRGHTLRVRYVGTAQFAPSTTTLKVESAKSTRISATARKRGGRARVSGSVSQATGGSVTIERRSGRRYKRIGTARVNSSGRFTARVRVGGSRVLRVRYLGTATTRPSRRTVAVLR